LRNWRRSRGSPAPILTMSPWPRPSGERKTIYGSSSATFARYGDLPGDIAPVAALCPSRHHGDSSPHQAESAHSDIRRHAAISFQVDAELLSAGYAPSRQLRLDALRRSLVYLPHSNATSGWYARVANARKALKARRRPGGDAGDADVWIIASALEHRLVLVSHDRQQIMLARDVGQAVLTVVTDLRSLNWPGFVP
jgi:predicted nucleic acid-binding protein